VDVKNSGECVTCYDMRHADENLLGIFIIIILGWVVG